MARFKIGNLIANTLNLLVLHLVINIVIPLQGFSVEGQENIQEILSKRLYLCQFLVALSILREGKIFLGKNNGKETHFKQDGRLGSGRVQDHLLLPGAPFYEHGLTLILA